MYQIQVYNSTEKSQKHDRTKCLDELISVMYDLVDNLRNNRGIKHFKTCYKRKKKVISLRYGRNTNSQKPRRLMRADLIFIIGGYDASFPV